MATNVSQKSRYVGQTKKLLRDGFGVYVYENQFYRYEGEWVKGKKHGHGKFIMKDGTFYEGLFKDGEIEGQGYKYFATLKCKYTGQFERGELHGYGVMQYEDGTMYEGEWAHNRKQGYGVYKTKENCTYQGEFWGSLRHGQGFMLYENGDRYVGNWVKDKRHGHGRLICMDGTEYEGQFFNDMFHGEGQMKHASGVIYEGNWVNGFPASMSAKLNIVLDGDIDPENMRQGQIFSIHVECLNELDELIPDQGRELQVSAGFRYYPMKEGSALFDMIEEVEENPVETPFGYSIVPYPLSDELKVTESVLELDESEVKPDILKEEDEDEEETNLDQKMNQDEKIVQEEQIIQEEKTSPEENISHKENIPEENLNELAQQEGTRPTSTTQETTNPPIEGVSDTTLPSAREDTPVLPPVRSQRTVEGTCDWSSLQLAPPPPMYRPFLAMEEAATKKGRSSSLKKQTLSKEKLAAKKDPSRDRLSQASTSSSFLDETCARPGEYVIVVQDLTAPPFFHALPPAFLLIKLKKKKVVKKKDNRPKWDTQKHIAQSMLRTF